MSRREGLGVLWLRNVPRASGDEPREDDRYVDGETCSPRERG